MLIANYLVIIHIFLIDSQSRKMLFVAKWYKWESCISLYKIYESSLCCCTTVKYTLVIIVYAKTLDRSMLWLTNQNQVIQRVVQ